MKFATYFDRGTYPKVSGTVNDKCSLTDQSFKAMCEIEQLLINYKGTPRTPVYDMENYDTAHWTFEDWQNEKAKCERKFLHLTPEERQKFGDVATFFKFCANPDNYQLLDGVYQEKPKDVTTLPEVDTGLPAPEQKPEA